MEELLELISESKSLETLNFNCRDSIIHDIGYVRGLLENAINENDRERCFICT